MSHLTEEKKLSIATAAQTSGLLRRGDRGRVVYDFGSGLSVAARSANADLTSSTGHDLAFRKMAVAHDALLARLGLQIAMLSTHGMPSALVRCTAASCELSASEFASSRSRRVALQPSVALQSRVSKDPEGYRLQHA